MSSNILHPAERPGAVTQAEINSSLEQMTLLSNQSHIADQKQEALRRKEQLYSRWLELKREIHEVEKQLKLVSNPKPDKVSKKESKSYWHCELRNGVWIDVESKYD